jgi:hypothetical protein
VLPVSQFYEKFFMSKSVLWEANIDGWQDIAVESYQFVIEQAKERLEELMQESNIILSRGMKILFSYVAALSGLAGFVFSDHEEGKQSVLSIIIVCIAVIFSIYVFTLLFAIISRTPKYFKGSKPSEIFYSEIFRDRNPMCAYKLLLGNEIERIEDKIQRIGSENRKHTSRYKSILRVSLILIALFIFAVFKKYFNN